MRLMNLSADRFPNPHGEQMFQEKHSLYASVLAMISR